MKKRKTKKLLDKLENKPTKKPVKKVVLKESIVEKFKTRLQKKRVVKVVAKVKKLDETVQKTATDLKKDIQVISDKVKELEKLPETFNKTSKTTSEQVDKQINDLKQTVKKDFTDAISTIEQNVQKANLELERELRTRLSNHGGGNMNRQIRVGGTDVLTRYTDINLVAGTGMTISTSVDSTDKNVDITFSENLGDIYLKLDQTTPQTISNGIPLLNVALTDFDNEKQIVNKEYVDNAINFISDYYFNNTPDAIGGIYYQMTDVDLGQPASTLTTGSLTSGDDQAVFNFITEDALGVNKLNSGVYKVHIHALKTGTRSVNLYTKLYTRTSGGTETLIATSTDTVELALTDTEFDIESSVATPITINTTDKLVVKFFANVGASGSDVTVSLNLEDDYNSRVSVPIESDVLNQIFVRQDGTKALTANWNAGAFDITANNFVVNTTTASRIAGIGSSKEVVSLDTATYPSLTELSYVKGVTSAIQPQIDAKFTLPALTSGSVLFSNGTTITQDNANFFWDDTNNYLRLGAALSGATTNSAATNLTVTKSNNGFITIDFQNRSNGTAASTDFIWYNDAGTDSVNYLDIGINSSTYTGSSILNGAGDAYIYNVSEDLMIGTATAGKNVVIFTGGTGGTAASKTRATFTDTGLQMMNGSAANPSISGTGATTTGFYWAATPSILTAIAGVNRLIHSATNWTLNSSNGGSVDIGGIAQYMDFGGTIVPNSATTQLIRTAAIFAPDVNRTNIFGINNTNIIGGSTTGLTLTTMSANRAANQFTGSVGITVTNAAAFDARDINNTSLGTVSVTNNFGFYVSQVQTGGATINAAFAAINTAAATRWNLYMSGNAQNWLAGNLGIGTGLSAPTAKLHLAAGSATANTAPIKLTSGTLTTSAEAGTMEFLAERFTLTPTSLARMTVSGALFTQTATVTVANTVTETTLVGSGQGTMTLPTNFFVAGKTIKVTARGYMSDTGTPNLRTRVKLGSTTVGDTGAIALVGTITNEVWEVSYILTCRTTGATGTVIGQGHFEFDNSTNSGLFEGMPATGTTTIDTTASQAVSVTVEWGTADVGNTISCTNLVLEVLN